MHDLPAQPLLIPVSFAASEPEVATAEAHAPPTRRNDTLTERVICQADRAVAEIRFADCLNHPRARGRLGIVLACLALAVTATNLEAVAITLVLRAPQVDLPSIYHAWKRR